MATKAEIMKPFQRDAKDTGSSEVQVALLTARIKHLSAHLKANKFDNSTRRGLLVMVNRRRKLLNYIRKHDVELYMKVTGDLEIRRAK